jgi:hypothetical protein
LEGKSLEKVALSAKEALKSLERRERKLIKDAKSTVKRLLEELQAQLPEDKKVILYEIAPSKERVAACILTKEGIVFKTKDQIIESGTIEDFVNAQWFSLNLAKSILYILVHAELRME